MIYEFKTTYYYSELRVGETFKIHNRNEVRIKLDPAEAYLICENKISDMRECIVEKLPNVHYKIVAKKGIENFNDLTFGEVFEFNDKVYMKHEGDGVIRLNEGKLLLLYGNPEVTVVDLILEY